MLEMSVRLLMPTRVLFTRRCMRSDIRCILLVQTIEQSHSFRISTDRLLWITVDTSNGAPTSTKLLLPNVS